MSAFSTLRITRNRAKTAAIAIIMNADDETLAEIMDAALRDRLYSALIVDDSDPHNDDDLLF